jgi:AraC-like DNA-binding protein
MMYQELLADTSKQGIVSLKTTEEVRHFLGSAPREGLYRCEYRNSLVNVVRQSNNSNHFTLIRPLNNSILIASMGAVSLVEPGSAVLYWPRKERYICLPNGITELYIGTLNEKRFSGLSLVNDHPSRSHGSHIYSEHHISISVQYLRLQKPFSESAKLEQIFLNAFAAPLLSPKASFSPKYQIPNEEHIALNDALNQIWSDPFFSWDLATCADINGVSPFHFSRIVSQFTGHGVKVLIDKCRARSFAYYAVNRLSNPRHDADRCHSNQLGVRKMLRDHTGFSAADLNYARKKLLNLGQVAKQYPPL